MGWKYHARQVGRLLLKWKQQQLIMRLRFSNLKLLELTRKGKHPSSNNKSNPKRKRMSNKRCNKQQLTIKRTPLLSSKLLLPKITSSIQIKKNLKINIPPKKIKIKNLIQQQEQQVLLLLKNEQVNIIQRISLLQKLQ